jgi:hypothetical protein
MSYEITNSVRSASIIRVTGTTPANIALSDLATSNNELVTSASIKRVLYSTGGTITIQRGTETVLSLYGNGDWRPSDSGHVIANNSTSNIVVTITTGGTALLEVTKQASYTEPLIGM